jgi:hypothetical protein
MDYGQGETARPGSTGPPARPQEDGAEKAEAAELELERSHSRFDFQVWFGKGEQKEMSTPKHTQPQAEAAPAPTPAMPPELRIYVAPNPEANIPIGEGKEFVSLLKAVGFPVQELGVTPVQGGSPGAYQVNVIPLDSLKLPEGGDGLALNLVVSFISVPDAHSVAGLVRDYKLHGKSSKIQGFRRVYTQVYNASKAEAELLGDFFNMLLNTPRFREGVEGYLNSL